MDVDVLRSVLGGALCLIPFIRIVTTQGVEDE